jgi:predicted secreted protein
LIFQKKSENIMAVKEVSEKEVKRIKQKDKARDSNGLSSQHHMAAEATIRRMKAFIRQKRKANGVDVTSQSGDAVSYYSQNTRRKANAGGESMTPPSSNSPTR